MTNLHINLIGEPEVFSDGVSAALPASRKTRALLGYLVLTGRPQRRDRLCDLFWEVPDDPRGALRWSLSKLRQVVNDITQQRLTADRERVIFTHTDCTTDIAECKHVLGNTDASKSELQLMYTRLNGDLLAGTDLPAQHEYQAWLIAEREQYAKLKMHCVARLCRHTDTLPDERLGYAKAWNALAPFDKDAAYELIETHRRLGQMAEVDRLNRHLTDYFHQAGLLWEAPDVIPVSQSVNELSAHDRDRELLLRQDIRFCTARDNVTIAYASVGKGTPLVKAANWLTHLELDWDAPIWSPLFRELARDHTFIRYDERGNGLSDWTVTEISFEKFVTDLESVVDAMQLEEFPLLGISQGAAVSIEYAVRHPERVSRLILFGGYAAGWRIDATPEVIKEREAVMTLTESGWGQDNPAYRHIFSATFMPSATAEQLAWFDHFQRQTTSAENAVRFLSAFGDIDVRHQLSKITVPTLVLHSRGDRRIPWEVGRDIAAAIPDARLVTIDSDSHLLLAGEPGAEQFVTAIRKFLNE